ncbi:hypothetical protein HY492_03525 [Candidatus Woesearchaeota archaeon]|nr:hypothetical protein [Candidatus Woesearchaeota archaeon]
MSAHQEFVDTAASIYRKIADTTELAKNGLKPMDALWRQHGGIFIAVRHPADICDAAQEMSERVAHIIPSWTYDRSTIHTSFPTSKQFFGYACSRDELDAGAETVRVCRENLAQPRMTFFRYFVTPDSVILGAIPADEAFYNGAQHIITTSKGKFSSVNERRKREGKDEIILGIGKIPNITINRFLTKGEPRDLEEVLNIIRTTPAPGLSKARSIDVGHWITDQAATPPVRIWNVYESFAYQ